MVQPPARQALARYGDAIGLAFQVVDDILDVTADSATLGKTAGKDAAQDKPTYVSLMGLDRSRAYAAALFDEVERQHPYSPWARRAQLMSAFSYYMAQKYNESIQSSRRFLSIHPGNKDASYAYYLIALSYYEQISDVTRDQKISEQALAALGEVQRRYPTSRYASDATLKIDLVRDHLAGKEMEIGRFYQRRALWLASSVRFR